MRIIYLPLYSPDLNPIAFLCIKAWIQANRDYVRAELDGGYDADPYQIFWEAVYSSVNADKARGWFEHSGYIA